MSQHEPDYQEEADYWQQPPPEEEEDPAPVNELTRALKAKYNDLRPYLKSGVLQEKIDELFNWFVIISTAVIFEKIAQARSDERKKVIEEIEKLKYGSLKSCDESYWYSRGDKLLESQVYFEALTDVLNQLKEEG